jgi:exodeoxyribonuclease V alpha subunit
MINSAMVNTPANEILENKDYMLRMLVDWGARGWLRILDLEFAKFLWSEIPGAPPLLILAAALTSHQLGRGHASLDLKATLADPSFALSLPPEGKIPADFENQVLRPDEVLAGVTLQQWEAELQHQSLVASGEGDTPLVLSDSRLYLRRYWKYEQGVRDGVERRLESSATLPIEDLHETLAALFPKISYSEQTNDWQKVACALASRNAFSIITGGPGTGKTTTVVKLLALLQAIELAAKPGNGREITPLRIRLAAPTGKAAARLNESIAKAVDQLPLAGLKNERVIRAAIPIKVTTLHRLLGGRPDTRHFRHHAGNPLNIDVLVIDEASMIDLEMMSAVLAALPISARIILLGDKDQLASVEAGAVLGELCQRAIGGHYTHATCEWINAATGEEILPNLIDINGTALDQAVVMLRHSHRFTAGSGIGLLAEAVNAGDTTAVSAVWNKGYKDLTLLPLKGDKDVNFRALVIEGRIKDVHTGKAIEPSGNDNPRRGYRYYLETLIKNQPDQSANQSELDEWASMVLQAHGQFQVLCALRQGPWGVEGLNQKIAHLLHEADLIPANDGWYLGRPVLVTSNDYSLGLMNGDIGITLKLPEGNDWTLRVAFPSGDGTKGVKWVRPNRLQAVETVYALTVHKSQGSEFSHTAMVLPDTINPILTRELIYTGITRASKWFTMTHAGSEAVLEKAISRRVLRMSGLITK